MNDELEQLCEDLFLEQFANSRNELVVIRGIPGSGKSTFAKTQFPDYKHFETDQFFINPETGKYEFDRTKLGQNHEACFRAVTEALMAGENVTVANTFVKRWEMQKYLDFCKQNRIRYRVFRMANKFTNEHGVPEEALSRMTTNFEPYQYERTIQNNPIDRQIKL